MSNHITRRIASLRRLVDAGLHLENLDTLIDLCSSLGQDSPNPLDFFVLKQVFADVSSALEGEAVTPERFRELTERVQLQASSILVSIESGRSVERSSLENLVRSHLTQLALFRER